MALVLKTVYACRGLKVRGNRVGLWASFTFAEEAGPDDPSALASLHAWCDRQ